MINAFKEPGRRLAIEDQQTPGYPEIYDCEVQCVDVMLTIMTVKLH